MLTTDGVEIVKDMKVWICPFFNYGTSLDLLDTRLEEHTVIETLNNCMVSTRKHNDKEGMTYPQHHRLTVFAEKKNAIIKRIDNLDTIRFGKELLLEAMLTETQIISHRIKGIVKTLLSEL